MLVIKRGCRIDARMGMIAGMGVIKSVLYRHIGSINEIAVRHAILFRHLYRFVCFRGSSRHLRRPQYAVYHWQ